MRLSSNKLPTLFGAPGAFCPRSEESKFALHHSCLFPGIFSRCDHPLFFSYLLSLEKSHRRDVPPRKLNSSNERCRAGVIEQTSCEIGKAFLSSVCFFLETTGLFDHDKKCARMCRNKFHLLFFPRRILYKLVNVLKSFFKQFNYSNGKISCIYLKHNI